MVGRVDLVVFGVLARSASHNALSDGAALDTSTMTWLRLPDAPPGTARDRHAAAAIDNVLYIDGGWPATGPLILKPQ